MAENKYFALQVSEPDGVVLIIQGNNLNCRLLKSHEKPGVLWLEFYKVESQEYSNCPVPMLLNLFQKWRRGVEESACGCGTRDPES